MGDVLQVEVEAAPLGSRVRTERRSPNWGLRAAIAVVGALTIALLATVVDPSLLGRSSQPRAGVESDVEETAPRTPPGGPVAAAEQALAAWGSFAVDGDLSHLDGTFHADGPQYRQLAQEAQAIAADASSNAVAYTVTVDRVETEHVSAADARLRASVAWTRPGEARQAFVWHIDMRRLDGSWLLWTVDG